jgi:RNA polymerase-binding transcription factor
MTGRVPERQELLERQRTLARERAAALAKDLDGVLDASTDVATDDEHDPEGQTIAFERAQLGALLDQARARLGDLDDALRRLAEGTYGVCETCGHPIAVERLAARPVARTCITCAR